MTDELRELLAAWYVSRVDEGMGYVSDINSFVILSRGLVHCHV
jgi:hypothetical protein